VSEIFQALVVFACGIFVGAYFMRSFDRER